MLYINMFCWDNVVDDDTFEWNSIKVNSFKNNICLLFLVTGLAEPANTIPGPINANCETYGDVIKVSVTLPVVLCWQSMQTPPPDLTLSAFNEGMYSATARS